MADRTITARIPEELGQQLDTLAAALRRDRTWVIKEALRGYISNEMQFLEAVEEGIRAADAGDLVDHSEVVKDMEARRRRLTESLVGNDARQVD
jgi:predicted transcriptional regulator